MRTVARVGLLGVCLALGVSAGAWETDLHYGLTKWLAVKAGFADSEAEAIAQGTQSADDGGLYPAPGTVMRYLCFGSHDAGASRFVQIHHFPSYATTPGRPSDRVVIPGLADNGANSWARKEITSAQTDLPRERGLAQFGLSLHPVQDSWSHQGEPDISVVCNSATAWGHPKKRGGYLSHNADLTYLHTGDTVATAKKTYDLLVAFGKSRGLLVRPPAAWADLEPQVVKFAEAATKQAKRRWFESDSDVPFSSYANQHFLDHISLPGGGKDFAFRGVSPRINMQTLPYRVDRDTGDLQHAIDRFLNEWIVEQQLSSAIELTDSRNAMMAMSEEVGPKAVGVDLEEILQVWLLADHGLVNRLDHGLTSRREFTAAREQSSTMQFKSLSEAIFAPGEEGPYSVTPITGEQGVEKCVVIFQFRHAPDDAIAIVFGRKNGAWRVLEFHWIVL